jgi:hypothetical protein
MPGTQTCGPSNEGDVFYPVAGGQINSTLQPFSINFGNMGGYATIGRSSYSTLEASAHHSSPRLAFTAGYTYSKAMDDSSAYTDQVNPVDPSLSLGLSAFDLTHNFVFSYTYEPPVDQLSGMRNRLTSEWKVSGIIRFSTGMPVTISENDDNSLLATCNVGQVGLCVHEPNYTPGKLMVNKNPRSGQPYLKPNLFTPECSEPLVIRAAGSFMVRESTITVWPC